MASIIPVAVTFFAVFIRFASVSEAGKASECTLSNVEVLSQLIDARINATVAARVAEFTATLEERFDAAVDEQIATTLNTTISALNASTEERIETVSTTVSTLNVTITGHIGQPGEVCSAYIH